MPVHGNHYTQFKSNVPLKDTVANGAAVVTKPIEHVEKIVNNTVDSFVPQSQDEETKKSHKTAIKVVSTVLVLSAIIPFLNPKFSSKLIDKMKTSAAKYKIKGKNSNTIIGKIYKGAETVLDRGAKILNFANNWNTFKDSVYKWLCDKTVIFRKPNELITKGFDKISKRTVYNKYEKAQSSLDALKSAILQQKTKLPQADAEKIDKLIQKAEKQQEYFRTDNVKNRLKIQEDLMKNLNDSTVKQMKNFAQGFMKKEGKMQHLKDNFSFWAEDIIMPQRNKIETEGQNVIQSIIGNQKTHKGTYDEIIDIITPHLKKDDKIIIEGLYKNASKKVNSANKTECIEYFNKKRDLMLGSAPTDVLTALIGLGASGVAIGSADSKEDRVSRAVTVAFPAVAGLGVSMGMTAMLYSGIKGMLIGAASSGLLSLTGSTIDKALIKRNNTKEVKNA